MYRAVLGILIFILSASGNPKAQCIYTDTVTLEDLSANNFYLDIEGVVNDDLSDPDQGVCRVSIHFNHDMLGNILIELISPAGETVALVGPTGDNDETWFSDWDVSFVPCGDMASPDPDFSAQWDSEEAWGIFGNYDGAYYPFNGCLEDFDEGSVNGTWTLHIEDNYQFSDGTFFEYSILFCDPSGISCQTCYSDAGMFTQGETVVCADEIDSFIWPEPEYENQQPPDTSLYGYRYILSVEDSITGMYGADELPEFLGDTFTVCGLSYLYADSLSLDSLDSLHSVSRLDSLLSSLQPPLCGSLSGNCVHYIIDSVAAPGRDSVFLCPGDSISAGDSVFTEPGQYLVVYSRDEGCDSAATIDVFPLIIRAQILPPDSLNCSRNEVVLDATASELTDSTQIHWTTPDGSFVSGTNTLQAVVDAPGQYILFLDNGSCWDTTEVMVREIDDGPVAMTENDTIDCGTDSLQIFGQSSEAGSSFSWSGPGGFIAEEVAPWVSQPGNYILTVTDSTGCTDTDTARVSGGGLLPMAEIHSAPLGCDADSVQLMVEDTANIRFYSWSGPSGFNSDDLEPWVTEPGWYDLQLTYSQECHTTISYELEIDTMPPAYTLVSDSLTCEDTLAQLAVLSQDSLQVEWTGPMGFTASGDSIETQMEGLYQLVIRGSNGCSATDSLLLTESIQPPSFIFSAEDLGCRPDSARINLTLLDPSAVRSVVWEGPAGFSSNELSPDVTEEGVYTLEVTGWNGCVNNGTLQVERVEDPPEISLRADTLDCQEPSVQIELTSSDELAKVSWTGAGSFVSDMESPNVSEGGWYFVEVTGTDSCRTRDSIYVHSLIDTPRISLEISGISCQDSIGTISAQVEPEDAQLQWSGPEPVLSDSTVIQVSTPGWYRLAAVAGNGCFAMDSILFEDTVGGPQFTLATDTLDCQQTEVTIQLSPGLPEWTFDWTGPGEFSSQSPVPIVDSEGTYYVVVTDSEGCMSRDSITVHEDREMPMIQLASRTDTLNCLPDTLQLDASGSDSSSVMQIEWSTDQGQIVDGDHSLQARVSLPGRYILEIVNRENGCIARDTVHVRSNPERPVGMRLELIPLACEGLLPGGVIVREIIGGRGPWSIALDGSPTGKIPGDTIEVDSSSMHFLSLEDAAGCSLDTAFFLEEAESPELELGPDITIQKGDQIWLHGMVQTDVPLTEILWQTEGISPPDSLSLLVMPGETEEYLLQVTDARNCSASDALTVFVEEDDAIYIPNSFTPNGDGINDWFYVFAASDALEIKSMRIYNRWGDMVFEARDIHPNDPGLGWDGRYKGKSMRPQVFVYVVELIDENGNLVRYTGDLSLIR